MKTFTKSPLTKLSLALICSFCIFLSATSTTNARTADFTIYKGWNLVGGESLLGNFGVLDKYVSFYYNPIDTTYHKTGDASDVTYQQYDRDYVPADVLRSLWIFNDGESFTVSVNRDNNRENSNLKVEEIGLQKLKKGWNLISITNSMYYADNGQPNNLSPNKIKGTCQIEKAFIYDASQQRWISWGTEVASFDDDTIGMGWAVKVANDCQLSAKVDVPTPPSIPN